MQTSEKMQKPEDVVRITLLLDLDKGKDERRVDGEVRPEDVLAWLQSNVSESEKMKFGRVEKVFEHGDWMDTVDAKMQWNVGKRYVVRG